MQFIMQQFVVSLILAFDFYQKKLDPVDTGRKLNVHKAFRRRPGRILNVLCTFVQFTFCVYGDGMGQISTNTKVIISISLTLFRIGGPKKPLTSFCPVTSTNVGISL